MVETKKNKIPARGFVNNGLIGIAVRSRRRGVSILTLCMTILFLSGCYSYHERNWTDLNLIVGETKVCKASWYGEYFHKKLTASGDAYDMYDLTCAHKKYPFGTIIRVTNLANGKDTVCLINDRGPYYWFRKLDLSYGTAKRLDFVEQGVGPVQVEVLGRDYAYARYVEYGKLKNAKCLTIQVGSFPDKKMARELKDQLDINYKDVYISCATEEHETHYRVRVGKFRKRAEALAIAARIAEEGYSVMILPHRS